jgi:hypothetical protein
LFFLRSKYINIAEIPITNHAMLPNDTDAHSQNKEKYIKEKFHYSDLFLLAAEQTPPI